jgi:hypothetical protein
VLKILPALQVGTICVLGRTYGVDEDILSLFQRAADVVDPPRILAARRCGGGAENKSCSASPKHVQEERVGDRVGVEECGHP